MRCASVARSGEEGLGDLLGGQPAHLAQGERHARFRRQRGMAAGKNQAQPIVFEAIILKAIILKAVLFIGAFRRTRLRFEISHELVLRRIKSCPATQSINGFESGRRNQPWSRVIGYSTSSATRSAQPQRLRASPPRQDQNHRASGSELPGFVPNPRDKGSRAIRVSARWRRSDMTTTLANQLPRINLQKLANGGSMQSAQESY